MLVGIHQPHYLAWLRYFEKIRLCDKFILLDDVEFTRNGWQNRNKLKTSQGAQILTVPVRHKAHQRINEVSIADANWARKHWQTLQQNYAAAPHFATHADSLQRLYEQKWDHLADLCTAQIEWQLQALDIRVPLTLSSELGTRESSTRRLVELVRSVGGTAYLTGRYALGEYLDPAIFRDAGVDLFIMDWKSPTYSQLWPKQGFIPDLSTLDILFNLGPEARATLQTGSTVERYVA